MNSDEDSDKVKTRTNSWGQKNDNDIKDEVLNIFKRDWMTLNDSIEATVQNGIVTLSGELEWNYQKEAAKTVIVNLIGVKGVINNIVIATEANIRVSKIIIERALKSHADINAGDITVTVSNKEIILTGSVETWFQKELAGRIVWKAPGVENVRNDP